MAKSGKIDPAFQAAPVLQDEYSPISFVQGLKDKQFQIQKALYEQKGKDTEAGLDKLMLDLKGWEDQAGFKELLDRQNNAINGFLELSRKGMNLVNPKTTEEVMAYKALTDYHAKTKQLADTWTQQKGIYDLYHKALEEDSKLPPEQQRIDHDASEKNIQEALKNNSIEGRAGKLSDLLVTKPDIGDVAKYINENKDRIPKLDIQTYPVTDANGQIQNVTKEVPDAKKEKEIENSLRKMYQYAPANIKNAVKQQGALNKDNEPEGFTDEDRFVAMARPQYKQKFIDKAVGKGGGLGIYFSNGIDKAKMTTGAHKTNDNNLGGKIFNDRYDFPTTKPFQVNALGGEKQTALADPSTGKNGWESIKDGALTKGLLQFYDAKSKRLVFKSSETEDLPWLPKNTLFSVPIENMPEAMDFPIKKDDGTIGTLKDIVGEQGPGEKQVVPDDFWNKKK